MSHSRKLTQELGKVSIDSLSSNTMSIDKGTVTQITSVTTGVTVSANAGVITTFSQSAAAGASATFAVTNTKVSTTSVVLVSIVNYAGTTGIPIVRVNGGAGDGTFNVLVRNVHASEALNGVLTISFLVL